MNNNAKRYKSKLKRKLQCSRAKKVRLLDEFSHSVDGFLEENPNANFVDLSNAFGPPEEMAKVLMDKLDDREKRAYKIRRLGLHIVAGVLSILLLFTSVYVFFIKQRPLIRDADVNITDDFVVTDTFIEGE